MNFALTTSIIILFGTLANYVIIRVENSYLRETIDNITAEKIVALENLGSRLKTASDEYDSCSQSKKKCDNVLKDALSKTSIQDAKISEDKLKLDDLTKEVSELKEKNVKSEKKYKMKISEIEKLTEDKDKAESELQRCREDKKNLLQKSEKKGQKEKTVTVGGTREKTPSSKLEKDENDGDNDNAEEENRLEDAKIQSDKGLPDEGHDRLNTGTERPSTKLENDEIGEDKDIADEENPVDDAKSEMELRNDEDHDGVNAHEKTRSIKLENDETDEAKDIADEDNHLVEAKLRSKKEIQKAELPDVDPNSVHVINRDNTGIKYHEDRDGNQVPVLPKDDPNATRTKAEHSVMDM